MEGDSARVRQRSRKSVRRWSRGGGRLLSSERKHTQRTRHGADAAHRQGRAKMGFDRSDGKAGNSADACAVGWVAVISRVSVSRLNRCVCVFDVRRSDRLAPIAVRSSDQRTRNPPLSSFLLSCCRFTMEEVDEIPAAAPVAVALPVPTPAADSSASSSVPSLPPPAVPALAGYVLLPAIPPALPADLVSICDDALQAASCTFLSKCIQIAVC